MSANSIAKIAISIAAVLGIVLSGGGAWADAPAFEDSWAPTGVKTDSSGLAFVEAMGILYGFYRDNNDSKLKLSANEYNYQTGASISSWTSTVGSSAEITAMGRPWPTTPPAARSLWPRTASGVSRSPREQRAPTGSRVGVE
jgi:hypothetical protein